MSANVRFTRFFSFETELLSRLTKESGCWVSHNSTLPLKFVWLIVLWVKRNKFITGNLLNQRKPLCEPKSIKEDFVRRR